MTEDSQRLLILVVGIIIVVLIFKKSLGVLIERIKELSIDVRQKKFRLLSHEEFNGVSIERTERDSVVRAKNIDKAGTNVKRVTIEDAREFYSRIAPYYNENNAAYLWEIHKRTVSTIINHIPPKPNILDLGGGTGRFLALEFFEDWSAEIGCWLNYDFSDEMLQEYRKNTLDLPKKFQFFQGDIMDIETAAISEKFDAVVMSFVLSSMKQSPDFVQIRKKMNRGGVLVISDGDPEYTIQKKCVWPAKVGDTRIELEIHPVNVPLLLSEAESKGFRYLNTQTVKKSMKDGILNYAFLLTFEAI